MIIALICSWFVAMWKEGEESPPLYTHIITCTNAHTHTIFTHHTSSHDGLHQTWNNRVMSSIHMQCTRGEFFTIFLSCSYVSITMVTEVSWWDYWSQLTALTEESFSIGSCCLYWKVEVNRFILCIPTLPNVTCTWQSMHTNQYMSFSRETKCLRSSVDVAGIRRAWNEARS